MPDVKVYIREENLDKWKAIPKKSDWLNTLLANSGDTAQYGVPRDTHAGPMVMVLSENVPRPKRDILADIEETKRAAAAELEYCQDPEEAKRIEQQAKDAVAALWKEYHEA